MNATVHTSVSHSWNLQCRCSGWHNHEAWKWKLQPSWRPMSMKTFRSRHNYLSTSRETKPHFAMQHRNWGWATRWWGFASIVKRSVTPGPCNNEMRSFDWAHLVRCYDIQFLSIALPHVILRIRCSRQQGSDIVASYSLTSASRDCQPQICRTLGGVHLSARDLGHHRYIQEEFSKI